MNEIIKKNKFLFIILIIAILSSLIFIYLIYSTNISRDKASEELNRIKRRVRILNNYKPSPTSDNLKMIQEDISHIHEETVELKRLFGFIYEKAITAFILELHSIDIKIFEQQINEFPDEASENSSVQNDLKNKNLKGMTEAEIMKRFFDGWESFIESQKNLDIELHASDIINNYRNEKKYTEKDFDKAKEAFVDIYQEKIFEKLTSLNIDDYILEALGIPLNFTRVRCKQFVVEVQKEINNSLHKANITSPTKEVILFDEFSAVPNDDQISSIIKYTQLYEDLFKKIIDSKIDTLTSYKKLNGLRGQVIGDYTVIKYSVTVKSSLDSIRDFLNSLQSAYVDNRIYVIKNISLLKDIDQVKNINKAGKAYNGNTKNQVSILIGTSQYINAEIDFDYIIYNKPIMTLF